MYDWNVPFYCRVKGISKSVRGGFPAAAVDFLILVLHRNRLLGQELFMSLGRFYCARETPKPFQHPEGKNIGYFPCTCPSDVEESRRKFTSFQPRQAD
jgi:hypothetical protein